MPLNLTAMPSLTARFYLQVVKQRLQRIRELAPDLTTMRAMREAEARKSLKLPRKVRIDTENFGHVAGEWLLPSGAAPDKAILYLHGGGYTQGSCVTHRALAAHLAQAARTNTLVINYRLAPEHPFPAALDDALLVYQQLTQRDPVLDVAIAGDSAGAGLAVALAITLRDRGQMRPAALGLLSPWVDLTLGADTYESRATVDPYFPTRERLATCADLYAAGQNLSLPGLSPVFGRLNDLPATMIHVGDKEVLLGDSQQLASLLEAAEGNCSLKVWPGMWHVWQHFAGKMREADDSLAELGTFLHERLTAHHAAPYVCAQNPVEALADRREAA